MSKIHNITPSVIKLLNGEIIIGVEKAQNSSGFKVLYNVAQLYIDHSINKAFLKEWIPGVPASADVKIWPDRVLAELSAGKNLELMYMKTFFPFLINEQNIPEVIEINKEIESYGGDVEFNLL